MSLQVLSSLQTEFGLVQEAGWLNETAGLFVAVSWGQRPTWAKQIAVFQITRNGPTAISKIAFELIPEATTLGLAVVGPATFLASASASSSCFWHFDYDAKRLDRRHTFGFDPELGGMSCMMLAGSSTRLVAGHAYGSVSIWQLEQTSALTMLYKCSIRHSTLKYPSLDIRRILPFNDSLFASVAEDGYICIFKLGDRALELLEERLYTERPVLGLNTLAILGPYLAVGCCTPNKETRNTYVFQRDRDKGLQPLTSYYLKAEPDGLPLTFQILVIYGQFIASVSDGTVWKFAPDKPPQTPMQLFSFARASAAPFLLPSSQNEIVLFGTASEDGKTDQSSLLLLENPP